jgi:hypothetical protein
MRVWRVARQALPALATFFQVPSKSICHAESEQHGLDMRDLVAMGTGKRILDSWPQDQVYCPETPLP